MSQSSSETAILPSATSPGCALYESDEYSLVSNEHGIRFTKKSNRSLASASAAKARTLYLHNTISSWQLVILLVLIAGFSYFSYALFREVGFSLRTIQSNLLYLIPPVIVVGLLAILRHLRRRFIEEPYAVTLLLEPTNAGVEGSMRLFYPTNTFILPRSISRDRFVTFSFSHLAGLHFASFVGLPGYGFASGMQWMHLAVSFVVLKNPLLATTSTSSAEAAGADSAIQSLGVLTSSEDCSNLQKYLSESGSAIISSNVVAQCVASFKLANLDRNANPCLASVVHPQLKHPLEHPMVAACEVLDIIATSMGREQLQVWVAESEIAAFAGRAVFGQVQEDNSHQD